MRVLGLDPGLRHTGWGIVSTDGNILRHVASGVISADPRRPVAERLTTIYDRVRAVVIEQRPDDVAVEETFVNRNPDTTLRLGLARGAVLVAAASTGLRVSEYATRLVKKSVVGTGRADKNQVIAMVGVLLPGSNVRDEDAADALAVAICHSHHSATSGALARRAVS